MCAKKEEEADCSQAMNNLQNYQDDLLHHQHLINQTQSTASDIFGTHSNIGFTIFPHQDSLSHAAAALPWSLPPPSLHSFNPTREPDPFLIPPPPPHPPSSFYGSFFNRRAHGLQFGYEGIGATSGAHHHHDHLRILSEALGPVVQAGSGPFGLQAELGKMTAQEIMDAKALAASKSHSEAERRRRERINNHLAKLRSILPNTTKTDKASLLAEVIQHVKELKRQTSLIAETNTIPTETDELAVDFSGEEEDGKFVIKASVCCDDRSDLLPDLIKTLKNMRLKTLKAEITTVGGRIKNVLFVTGEEHDRERYCDGDGGEQQPQPQPQYYITSIQEALKAVMEKSSVDESSSSGNAKRQRMSNSISIIEQQQQQQR